MNPISFFHMWLSSFQNTVYMSDYHLLIILVTLLKISRPHICGFNSEQFILFFWFIHLFLWGCIDFPGGSDDKASVYNVRDLGSIPGLGRFPGEGNGNPLQYCCLENPMDGGVWCRQLSMGSQRVRHDWATSLYRPIEQNKELRIKNWLSLEPNLNALTKRLPGEISITWDMQMTPPLWQKVKRNQKASWWKWKRRVNKLA